MEFIAWYSLIWTSLGLACVLFLPDDTVSIERNASFRFIKTLFTAPIIVFFVWFLFFSK